MYLHKQDILPDHLAVMFSSSTKKSSYDAVGQSQPLASDFLRILLLWCGLLCSLQKSFNIKRERLGFDPIIATVKKESKFAGTSAFIRYVQLAQA